MGRPRTPAGKRVTLSCKVSEDTAARIEQARGTQRRSAFIAAVMADGLDGTDLRAEVARLAAELEDTRAELRSPRCNCGTSLACPSCRGGGDYA